MGDFAPTDFFLWTLNISRKTERENERERERERERESFRREEEEAYRFVMLSSFASKECLAKKIA